MRTIRFPIAGLMLAVLVVAVALAALRNASETWSGVMFLMTCGVLCLAIVGVVCRDGPKRAWWLGFALFGWGYLLLSLWSTVSLPTMALLDAIAARLGMQVRFSGGMGGGMMSVALWAGGFGGGGGGPSNESLREIAHCLWALAAALFGEEHDFHGTEPRVRRRPAQDKLAPLPRPARPYVPHTRWPVADYFKGKRGRAGLSGPVLDFRTLSAGHARGRRGRDCGADVLQQTPRAERRKLLMAA